MTHLLVTVDVECDKSRTWHTADPLAFRGVHVGIGERLQPLLRGLGARPTYLISPEVLADDAAVELLRGLKNKGDAELGAHLHGEYIGPGPAVETLPGSRTEAMQADYAPEVERAKLAALTELFKIRVGSRATSFRAGRFGVGPATGRFLAELGYVVDSSVTPHVRWRDAGPDFRGCPELPYFVGENHDLWTPGGSRLLEVPVTVLAAGCVPDARPVWASEPTREPTWFRPWYADEASLQAMVRRVADAPPRPLVMMFHNVELVADASPYTRSEADVERYLGMLRIACEAALAAGFVPATLSEYAAWWASEGRR